jgi:uncharacterized protein DUF3562
MDEFDSNTRRPAPDHHDNGGRLRNEFGHIDPRVIQQLFAQESRTLLREARVLSFIDILTERRVRERLRHAPAADDSEPRADARPSRGDSSSKGWREQTDRYSGKNLASPVPETAG